ncbi:hypothetical protein J3459_013076 [Metarhizium acridum]|nr:hypothetical protein J3459_013076 [Metarhizium acridum]
MAYASTHPNVLSVIIEVEFLVAVEKDGYKYNNNTAAAGNDTESTASQIHKWTCPSQADDPSMDVLHQCRAVLSRNNANVIIRHNETHLTERSWQSARFDSWILQPRHSAFASSGSPANYDWSGVKLRSPLMPDTELNSDLSPVHRCVETLRRAIFIYVDASCKLSVSLRPNNNFTLVQAKKLATLVWLTERDLLVPLRHLSRDAAVVCPRAVTTASLMAISRHGQMDVAEPLDPLLEGIMHSHLPTGLGDSVARGCLQRLWACSDLAHLSSALRDRHHSPLAFALYVYDDDDDAEDSNTSCCAVASFRCAPWHPRHGLDVSPHWTDLVLTFGRAMSLASERFKGLVAEIDETNCASRQGDADGACHRTRLMKALGTGDARCAEWECIVADCRNGAP